jgi:hypothetical protein
MEAKRLAFVRSMSVINAADGLEKASRPIRCDLPDKDASEEQNDSVCRVIAADGITGRDKRNEKGEEGQSTAS